METFTVARQRTGMGARPRCARRRWGNGDARERLACSTAQLKDKYREVFSEDSRSNHKQEAYDHWRVAARVR